MKPVYRKHLNLQITLCNKAYAKVKCLHLPRVQFTNTYTYTCKLIDNLICLQSLIINFVFNDLKLTFQTMICFVVFFGGGGDK